MLPANRLKEKDNLEDTGSLRGIIVFYFLYDIFYKELYIEINDKISFLISFYLIFLAIFFNFISNRFIRNDELLVRESERIR